MKRTKTLSPSVSLAKAKKFYWTYPFSIPFYSIMIPLAGAQLAGWF